MQVGGRLASLRGRRSLRIAQHSNAILPDAGRAMKGSSPANHIAIRLAKTVEDAPYGCAQNCRATQGCWCFQMTDNSSQNWPSSCLKFDLNVQMGDHLKGIFVGGICDEFTTASNAPYRRISVRFGVCGQFASCDDRLYGCIKRFTACDRGVQF